MDSSLKLQGNGNTKFVLDEHAFQSNRLSALICISNSSVELDGLQLDAYHNHPNTLHHPYSSGYAGQSISVLTICSSSIVVSNSEIRVPPQQSPFVITCSEHSGGDETTRICVKSSSLFSSSSISGATTLILPNTRHSDLCISMMSCNINSAQIGSDTGLLAQVAHSPRSNKNCGRIETLLSGNRIENVTRTSSGHFNPNHQGLWSQRLISNSITNSTSVLCGSLMRDLNLGGDFLSSNNSFVSCATSSVQPIPRRELEFNIFRPYLGPNLRQDKSDDGTYEWEEKSFGKRTLFHFFDFGSDRWTSIDGGSRFLFSSFSHTIRFARCTFTDIDGKDPDDKYRDTDGAAIIIRCPSSLVVEVCQFVNCGGGMDGGVIEIIRMKEHTTTSITSSSFEECWTKSGSSSVLHHDSLGTVTLTASNFSNNLISNHRRIISSEGIIVSNCQFNYNGSMFYYALEVDGEKSQFFFTSFFSDTKAERDVYFSYSDYYLGLFVGCFTNSYQPESFDYLGFSLFNTELLDGEVVVDTDLEPDSLQTALTGNPDADTFFLRGGRYGTFEIDSGNVSLKPWNSQDNLNATASVVTSFSATVKAGAECWITMFQLAPLDESSSLASSQGVCLLRDIVVDQIDYHTVPLFLVSGSGSHLSIYECQITNGRNAAANLIQARDGAEIDVSHTIITQITTTQSVISAQDCSCVALFRTTITHVHRTEGEGPAAVDFIRPSVLSLIEFNIRNCVSDEGNVGGIHLITSPHADHQYFSVTCMSNAAAPGKLTHVLVEGLSEDKTRSLLRTCKLYGTAPHFGWVNEDDSGTGFGAVDFSDVYFTLTTTTMIQNPHLLRKEGMHPTDFHLDDIFSNLPTRPQVYVYCDLPLDVPIVQKPATFTKHHLQLSSRGGVGTYPNAAVLQQDSSTLEESLFTLQTSSNVELQSLAIQLDSQTTSPLVKVDALSTFVLSDNVVFGGVRQFHRPLIESSGNVEFLYCNFYGLSFHDRTCIEMSGGSFTFKGNTGPSTLSSVMNVSTTGKGAFLSSSHGGHLEIKDVFFVNCSAEAGGAIFVEDAQFLDISSFFDTCIASTGAAVMIVDNTGSGEFNFYSTFINCQAQRGGGLFLSLSEGSEVSFGSLGRLTFFGRDYFHAAFENCVAEKGAGVYVEGTMKGDDFDSGGLSFNNWNAEGLGTDIFFAKSVKFDDLSSQIESMLGSTYSTSRQSTNLSKQCQVYFESSPSDSFDFRLPEFGLSGSGTDVASPLTTYNLYSFRSITPNLHLQDDRGRMINATVFVRYEFCIFERGFCSSQHISFIKDDKAVDSQIQVTQDSDAPLYDLVALELDSDAVIEFHNLIFAIDCPFQMMLVKHRSAWGLIETCQFLFDAGMELPLPLFEVEDGTLSLTQTLISVKGDEGTFTVNDFVLHAAPLILVSPADTATSSPVVILDHVSLRRMRLKLGVDSLMLFDFSASVDVNEVEFIECNQTESKEATRIIATGSNLEGVVDKWKGFEWLADLADHRYLAIDNAESLGSLWHTIPLRVALFRFEGQTITVEKTGKDLAGCGEGSWNCRGLVRAGKNVGGNQPCTITVVESSFLNGVFDPPAKRTSVESSSSKSVIEVEKEGRMVNSPDGKQAPILTLSHLSFSLPLALDTDSLIESLGGEVTVKNCWFVSSSPISFHLLSASSGVVDIDSIVISELEFSSTLIKLVGLDSATIKSLTLSDLPEMTLVSAEGQPSKKWTLTIKQSTFTSKSTSSNEVPTDSEKLCSWESGLVVLNECVCEISWTQFRNLSQGAIHATNSSVTLSQSDLTHNGLPSASFPSARQNIRCVGTGKISFESFSAESPLAENDMWVSADDKCVVDGENISPRHTFFEPSLITKNCSSEFVKKEDRYEVEIVGIKLVPCGLWLEVFEDDSSSANADKHEVIDLSELATGWTETSLSLTFPASRLSTLSNTHRWLARIEFGRGHTTDSFELKMSAKKARAIVLSHTLPWLIPLIIVIIIAVIVLIVVIVVLRRQKTKEPEPGSEMERQDDVEVEKLEDADHTPSNAPNSALTTLESKMLGVSDQTVQQHMIASGVWSQKDEFVEAVACSGEFGMEVVRKTDTLSARLHTEQGRKIALAKEPVRQQLVKGILKIWETNQSAKILTKLSSHIVIVDAGNNVFLNVQGEQVVSNGDGQDANRQAQIVEARRWSPPELDNENTVQNSIDISKVAVFSLGLILWEMETDSVPFGEVDAVNAQRQMGVGSTLNMDGVKNSKMKEMIEMCLSTDPNDRPTLSELNEFINPEPIVELKHQPNDPTA
ncbi:hypothetical protein BLNAU_9975 [Blattamonas nauphoetae]|uniref:Protein kinase domain-containing protein n=1 Tax=Blattamonas nauphoetae TaxID=2049346 RepID=A0ABQ9XU82_9EUKA|nr:hypothetical protein BLNAU_9975 [Blattamonas nauphoetae]